MKENKNILPLESDLKPKFSSITVGPIQIGLTNGLYGLTIFIIMSFLLHFFASIQNIWLTMGASAILSAAIAASTHNIMRHCYYRFFQNKIPLVETIKDSLISTIPENEEEI